MTDDANIIGITPAIASFNGIFVFWAPTIFLPTTRFAYWTGILLSAFCTNTTAATSASIPTTKQTALISPNVLNVPVPNIRFHTSVIPDAKPDTIPTNIVCNNSSIIEHEASVSKISEEELFYLMSRGLDKAKASQMIVMGFIEPFAKELPMEYAVELNNLIKLEMEGSIGWTI